MSWFDDVIDYIGIPNAIEKRRCFVLDGCRINFGTLPDPSLVLSVPHLQSPNSPVRKFIEGHERCDLFVVALRDANPIVVFVEAKSGNDRDYRHSEKAVSQLRSSFGIIRTTFSNISAMSASVLPKSRRVRHARYMPFWNLCTQINDAVLRSINRQRRG